MPAVGNHPERSRYVIKLPQSWVRPGPMVAWTRAGYSSNLTSDRDTGIGALTDAQVVAGIYGVKPNGLPVMPLMPWPYYDGRIAEADLEAIVAFLRSLPAIRNVVPPAEQPAKR